MVSIIYTIINSTNNIHDESKNNHVFSSFNTFLDHLQYEMIVFDINVNITDFVEWLVQISKGLPTFRM